MIGNINIRYKTPLLRRKLDLIKKHIPFHRAKNKDLSKYLLKHVTSKGLRPNNILFPYIPGARSLLTIKTKTDHAVSSEILFSGKGRTISNKTSFCLSSMLFCNEMKLATAVHTDEADQEDLGFLKDMFLFAYANMNKLVGNRYPLHAFISGLAVILLFPIFNSSLYTLKSVKFPSILYIEIYCVGFHFLNIHYI